MNASLRRLLTPCFALLAFGLAGQAIAADGHYEKADSYRNPAIKAGGSLDLTNMLGHVSLVAASDGVLEIDSKVVAVDKSDQAAESLAGKVHLEISASGNAVKAVEHYPLDEYSDYYYHYESEPGLRILGINISNSHFEYEGERVSVSTGNFGGGVNLHVDFVVHVPKGVRVTVDHKVGRITAEKVEAPLLLQGSSADIQVSGDTGSLDAHTGSGDIGISDQDGAVTLTSGSGDISIDRQKGGAVKFHTGSGDAKLNDVAVALDGETGSGEVVVEHFSGDRIELETGSGDISLSKSTAKSYKLRAGSGEIGIRDSSGSLEVHSGSGDINVNQFKAGESVEFRTGSGEIMVDADLGAVTHLMAESGSGDITLRTSTVPSLHIEATANSGEVDVSLPDMQNVSARSHSLRADVNGAKGSAELESGSGDISFKN